MRKNVTAKTGFNLVELLVTIAIIAILAGVLLPALNRAKDKAKRTTCLNNLRQINLGLRMYSDDSRDISPNTPGTGTNWSLSAHGYKNLMKNYVGLNGVSSAREKLFACPADTFYYSTTNGSIVLITKGAHEELFTDYSSYKFNGGNLDTNMARFGLDPSSLGIAGRTLSSIKNPTRTVLVYEGAASLPFSWHRPKLPLAPENERFNDSMNVMSFVDGHVSFIKIYWSHTITNGALFSAEHENPPARYDYQWSGD